jgi:hypothetical protein
MTTAMGLCPVPSFLEGLKKGYQGYCVHAAATMDYVAFAQGVRELSSHTQGYIKSLIASAIPDLNDSSAGIAVALTGSDGRMEKSGSSSKADLIVVTTVPEASLSSVAQLTLCKIRQLVQSEPGLFFNMVEEKALHSEEMVSIHVGKKDVSAPTRAFDAQFVAGSAAVFVEYKARLQQELVSEAKINNLFKKTLLKDSLRQISAEVRSIPSPSKKSPQKSTGKILGVDTAKGIVRTDGKYVQGPKYGILRSIQYSVAYSIFQRASHISPEDFGRIPSSVPDRIDWLRDKKLTTLSPEDCDSLKQCYRVGLYWYSCLQCEIDQRQGAALGSVIEIPVDGQLLVNTVRRTDDIVSRLLSDAKRPGTPSIVQQNESPSKRLRLRPANVTQDPNEMQE